MELHYPNDLSVTWQPWLATEGSKDRLGSHNEISAWESGERRLLSWTRSIAELLKLMSAIYFVRRAWYLIFSCLEFEWYRACEYVEYHGTGDFKEVLRDQEMRICRYEALWKSHCVSTK